MYVRDDTTEAANGLYVAALHGRGFYVGGVPCIMVHSSQCLCDLVNQSAICGFEVELNASCFPCCLASVDWTPVLMSILFCNPFARGTVIIH